MRGMKEGRLLDAHVFQCPADFDACVGIGGDAESGGGFRLVSGLRRKNACDDGAGE
jgi:hypothetical protein